MKKNVYVVFEKNVEGEDYVNLFETYDKALEYFNSIKLEIKESGRFDIDDIEVDRKNYFQWFDANINEFSSSILIVKKEIQ